MHEMRRKDRSIEKDDCVRILMEGEYGVLSTADGDNVPHGTPLSYAFDGGSIWFHSAITGHTRSNIETNPKVSFVVVGRTEVLPEKFSTIYESVIAKGTVRICSGAEQKKGLMLLTEKYCPSMMARGSDYADESSKRVTVYRLDIESITGKARYNR